MHVLKKQEAALLSHTALLFGYVAAASYAGNSNLFAAYRAGASIGWHDSEVAQPCDIEGSGDVEAIQSTATILVQHAAHNESGGNNSEKRNNLGNDTDHASQELGGQNRTIARNQSSLSGASVYKTYIEQPDARILKPFFFVSANEIITLESWQHGSGFDWVLYSNHMHGHRHSGLARHCLYSLDAHWEVSDRYLAFPKCYFLWYYGDDDRDTPELFENTAVALIQV